MAFNFASLSYRSLCRSLAFCTGLFVCTVSLAQEGKTDEQKFAEVRRSRDVVLLGKYAQTLSAPWSDSCLVLLHDAYVASANVPLLASFHEKYGDRHVVRKMFRRKDMAVLKAVNKKVPEEAFIRVAAPYPVALIALQKLVEMPCRRREYESAVATALSFADVFGSDRDYRKLVATLSDCSSDTIVRHKLGKTISTEKMDEYCPVVSARCDVMYFCRSEVFDNVATQVSEDVYSCRYVNGEWTGAAKVSRLSDPKKDEAPLSMSVDGSKLLVFVDGKICESIMTSRGWSEPAELSSNINSAEWQSDAMITADGRAILFASSAPTVREVSAGGSVYRRSNIFVSLRQKDGSWGKPIDLGPNINTSLGDRSPYLHPDMRTLYFSSEGHGSIGGMDVYVSHRLRDDSWTEWSEPENLGRAINDNGENVHYLISTDGRMAYFSASEDGKYDIYWTAIPPKSRPAPVATFSGRVVGDDCAPKGGTVLLRDAESGVILQRIMASPSDGTFFGVCPLGRKYVCVVEGEEFAFDLVGKNDSEHIDVPERQVTCFPHIDRVRIYFDKDRATLTDESRAKLDGMLATMGDFHVELSLVGHTDSDASHSYNMRLSERRAATVREYLISHGCHAERVSYTFKAESEPIADNSTPEGMALNRRVEVDVSFVGAQ